MSLADLQRMGGFADQSWYVGHAFWTRVAKARDYTVRPFERPPAVVLAYAALKGLVDLRERFVWAADTDDFEQRVYLGMTGGGFGAPTTGLQVHRHLNIDHRWCEPWELL